MSKTIIFTLENPTGVERDLTSEEQVQLDADIAKAKTNIDVYIKNPAGIGEHPDLVAAVDEQVDKMAQAHDKLEILKQYYER